MSNKKPTETEQKTARNKAKTEIDRIEKILADETKTQIVDKFRNKFNICEIAYKTILSEHQKFKGKKPDDRQQITMTQVPYALKFAGYNFKKDDLNELFGSKSSKGKTVKKLRDEITHTMSENAVNEIINRQAELFKYMDDFINTIKTFDAKNT